MYVALRDCAVYQAGWPTLREGLKALGVGPVEVAVSRDLSIPHPALPEDEGHLLIDTPEHARAARDSYQQHGREICALFLATNLNAERREEELAWIAGARQVAEALGARVVRIDAAMTGQHTLPLEQRVQIFAEACREVLEQTPTGAPPLGIETHGNQGTDPRWLRGVLEQLEPASVGLTLDPANLYWAGSKLERVYELVAEFAPRTVHVHCKNLSLPTTTHDKARGRFWQYAHAVRPLYEGDIDQRRVVELLAEQGYQGALAIEEEALAEYSLAERVEVLSRDVKWLKEAMKGL